jgi:hypothetical protein
LSHSEIHGSKLVRSSPWLIAAYHVLHRLLPPRHPPNALKSLDRSHYQCSPLGRGYQPCGRNGALTKRPDHSEMNPAPARLHRWPIGSRLTGPGKSPFYDVKIDRKLELPNRRRCLRNLYYFPLKRLLNGGACRDRTGDLKLAKLPLSQLS